jgi:ketosteroid isomerase-like protein
MTDAENDAADDATNDTSVAERLKLVETFRIGFHRVDEAMLRSVLSDDFVWHMHFNAAVPDGPTGKVLRGLDELIAELTRRREAWTDTWFEGLRERTVGEDGIIQTFTATGTDEHGKPFNVNVVDLYDVRDGLITKKDTYWKGIWTYAP